MPLPLQNDLPGLTKFFSNHSDYTINELALKYSTTAAYVRKLMGICGIKKSRHKNYKNQIKKKYVDAAENVGSWRSREWLTYYYCDMRYSAERIAKLVGVAKRTVQKSLTKFGIKQRPWNVAVGSQNKCCSLEWLTENYIKQLKTTHECAREAGVNSCTITNWLIKFSILPRDPQCALAKRWYKKKYGKVV